MDSNTDLNHCERPLDEFLRKNFTAIKNRSNITKQPHEKHKFWDIYETDAKTATCDAQMLLIIFSQ